MCTGSFNRLTREFPTLEHACDVFTNPSPQDELAAWMVLDKVTDVDDLA
jgi:hypothetical protein